ncbi:tyrosine-type recombinase/integrase [Altererythrobacter litoralis]|uniref:Tyrosine-type recombinase/integrase n=1 Tax=Altererythrobacter litoralis TaxID=3113904 RepID=A0ABU7GGL5_9SPHN|nr:tyrosine-type recombinase/integrase [Erythrobacteraceae bacterium 1XM1-14]
MVDLSKIGERAKLKPRPGDEPHWQPLRKRCYVGYRPAKKGPKGTWHARAYDTDAGQYRRKVLGDYGTLSGHEVYNQAKADAEEWAVTVESGGMRSRRLVTVRDACEDYLKDKPNAIAEGVFRRHVYDDPVAKVALDKLRRHHLRDWRQRLEEAPALISRSKNSEKRTKERSKSTINRDMVPVRAALRRVLRLGAPNTDGAWQEALKPYKGANKRRDLYLDREERMKLAGAADGEIRPFIKGLCILPLRPGALAQLKVKDFDKRTRVLAINKDKNGKRKITIPPLAGDFFGALVSGKAPHEFIFSRENGAKWNNDTWNRPIKRAANVAGLSNSVVAYTVRHSVITDLIRARLPILTVAQLAGTSVNMIEEHYGHLVSNDAEEALASIAF